MMPPPGYSDGATAPRTVSPDLTASEWSVRLADPLTYAQGLAALNEARIYAWKQIDRICSGGTCPPASALAPELVKRIKAMDVARDGFEVMVKKGAGFAKMPSKLRDATKIRGGAVITEANRIWVASVTEDARIKDKFKAGFSWLKASIIVVGIFGVGYVISRVGSTARNVRLTVRGYPNQPQAISGGS